MRPSQVRVYDRRCSPPASTCAVCCRYLTDISFGNRHGMLTVRVQPLTAAGEPLGVVAVGGAVVPA